MKRFLVFLSGVCGQLLWAEGPVIVGHWANGEIVESHAVFARQDTVMWNVAVGDLSDPVWRLEAKNNDGSYKLMETVVTQEYELSIDTCRLHCKLFQSLEQLPASNDSSVYFQARVTVGGVAGGVNVCDTFPFYLNLLPEKVVLSIASCDSTHHYYDDGTEYVFYVLNMNWKSERSSGIEFKRTEYWDEWLLNRTYLTYTEETFVEYSDSEIGLKYENMSVFNEFGKVWCETIDIHKLIRNFYEFNSTVNPTVSEEIELNVYPNPVGDVLFLSSAEGVRTVFFIDATGRVVKKTDCPEQGMDVSTLAPGVYYILVPDIMNQKKYIVPVIKK